MKDTGANKTKSQYPHTCKDEDVVTYRDWSNLSRSAGPVSEKIWKGNWGTYLTGSRGAARFGRSPDAVPRDYNLGIN